MRRRASSTRAASTTTAGCRPRPTCPRCCRPRSGSSTRARSTRPGARRSPRRTCARVRADELGAGPWGQAGSPTTVGAVRVHEVTRQSAVMSGVGRRAGPRSGRPARVTWRARARVVARRGGRRPAARTRGLGTGGRRGGRTRPAARHPRAARRGRTARRRDRRSSRRGDVRARRADPARGVGRRRGGRRSTGATVEDDAARALGDWVVDTQPWAVLAPSTAWGREVASRAAAARGCRAHRRRGRSRGRRRPLAPRGVEARVRRSARRRGRSQLAGADGDRARRGAPAPGCPRRVVARGVDHHRDAARPRPGPRPHPRRRPRHPRHRARGRRRGSRRRPVGVRRPRAAARDAAAPSSAPPARSPTPAGSPAPVRSASPAAASRPRLFVSIGASGKFNHMVGVRAAGTVLAINPDPDALVFGVADVGIVADWHDAVPRLVAALARTTHHPIWRRNAGIIAALRRRLGERGGQRSMSSASVWVATSRGRTVSVANAAGRLAPRVGQRARLGVLDRAPHPLGRARHVDVTHAEVAERVDHRVLHRGRAPDRAPTRRCPWRRAGSAATASRCARPRTAGTRPRSGWRTRPAST